MTIKKIINGFLGLLGIYSLVRLAFLILNFEIFQTDSLTDILWAFVIGLRFDIAAICLFTIAFVPLIFFPIRAWHKNKKIILISRVLFLIAHGFALLSNLVDIQFVNESSRRLTFDTLKGFNRDIAPQAFQLIQTYAFLMNLWAVGLFLIWKLSKYFFQNTLSPFKNIVSLLACLFLMVLGSRGGLQPKVLHPAHANAYFASPSVAELSLNGPFALLRKPKARKVVVPKYFESYDAALKIFDQKPSSPKIKLAPKTNVILMVLESLGSEYMGEGGGPDYTPFLSKLKKEGASFFGVANGQTSIESLAPILLGIPNLLPNNYITSMYHTNRIQGMGLALSTKGYKSAFFHSGQKGTMYFDSYAKIAGIEDYYGLETYPHPEHHDGAWGIPDHHFLEFMSSHLDKYEDPFLAVFFSLSTHAPFKIPPGREGRYPKGPLRVHEAMGYMDEAIKEFFEVNKHKSWFQNTLFVFIADHTYKSFNPLFLSPTGRKRIPIFFYHPKVSLTSLSMPQKIVQQADIPKSVYDLIGYTDLSSTPLSRSAFNTSDTKGAAMFRRSSCVYQVEGGEQITFFRLCGQKEVTGPYDFLTDGLASSILDKSHKHDLQKERAKARTQVFYQGITENLWSPKP